MNTNPNRKCINCKQALNLGYKHCPNCGQKTVHRNWSLLVLIGEFLSTLLNVDSKLVQTLRDIWIPAKLTKKYFSGNRIRYYHPMRLLVVTVFGAFAIALLTADFTTIESIQDQWTSDKVIVKQQSKLNLIIDSLVVDTLLGREIKNTYAIEDPLDSSETDFSLGFIQIGGFDRSDLLNYSAEEIIKKNEVKKWYEKLMIYQFAKLHKDPKGMAVYLISNTAWAIFVLILLMAIVLKLIYLRSNYYYVEHFVLLSHITSFGALITLLAAAVKPFFELEHFQILFITSIITIFYGWIALKRYYRQGWFKTFIKFLIVLISLTFFLVIIGSLMAFIGFLIF